LINTTVEKYVSQVKLTTPVRRSQLEKLMSFIYGKIESQLFERDEDKVKRYEVYMA